MSHKEDIYWLGLAELQKRFPDHPIADLQASVDKFRKNDKALTSSAMILASAELENPDREIEVADSGLAWFVSKEGVGEKFITEYHNPYEDLQGGCKPKQQLKPTLVVKVLYTAKTYLGVQFDQSEPEGSPLEVRENSIIEGLIITFLDMKLKEKRTVIVPAYLGFTLAHDASSLGINANDALLFDLEILGVQESKQKDNLIESISIDNGNGTFKPSDAAIPLPPHWQPPPKWDLPDDWAPPESWGLPDDWKMKKS